MSLASANKNTPSYTSVSQQGDVNVLFGTSCIKHLFPDGGKCRRLGELIQNSEWQPEGDLC